MNTLLSENLLQTVQLIPIFNYLNILSDFLFIENYLSVFDQTKQIPIVNALYGYLEDHRFRRHMKIKLVRHLLQGSDLYGANDNEEFDVTFVNVMFDYIVSSLVFDKYGNIYGFLANVFGKAKTLQVTYVFELIKENLENASFENEYGDSSSLSPLSVKRIYDDIIMPLFPHQKDLNISSLDYIYAQAGLMFLRAGRINNVYYPDFKNDFKNLNADNFNEYLMTGHVIEKLLLTEEKNNKILNAFALPALSNYIFKTQYLFVYKNVVDIISDLNFWHSAYNLLFQNIITATNNTKVQLKNDYNFKLHTALFNFRTRTSLAKHFLNLHCLDEIWKNLTILSYLENSENRRCENREILPDLNQLYLTKLKDILEIYKTYDLQLVKRAFGKLLLSRIKNGNVTIKLLCFYDQVEKGDFSNSKQLSYDLLQFSFHESKTCEYYALIRENYNVTLISKENNSYIYWKKVGLSDEILRSDMVSTILKTPDSDINEFWENLMEHKTTRLQMYLKFLDSKEENESWKSDWWKEFGLSLVPHYPCLSSGDNCGEHSSVADKINFLNKVQSSKILHVNSLSLLSSLGTNILSVILTDTCDEATELFVSSPKKYQLSLNAPNVVEVFDNIRFHIEEPGYELTFVNLDQINLLKKIISNLIEETNFRFVSVKSHLNRISALKSKFFTSIGVVSESRTRLIYINTLNNQTKTGYGYKFAFLTRNMSETAQLRTDDEFKEEILVLRKDNLPEYEKTYITLNNASLEPEPNHLMYEIDNKLQRKSTRSIFFKISTYPDDYKCDTKVIFYATNHSTICLRQKRYFEKLHDENEAILVVQNSTNFSEKHIRNILKKYLFPDYATLLFFVKSWIADKNYKAPAWSDNYLIDNPDLLTKLQYFPRLENYTISEFDGTFRINSIYSLRERRKIEEQTSLKTIIKDYNDQKESYSVTFEDYYAIRNFATTGYRRITRDTHEANLMKYALYKLAIRQSDDPDEEIEFKLFRVESKRIDISSNIFSKSFVTLRKFTLASVDVESALRFATYPAPGFMNVMYEMIFFGTCVRVKIEEFYEQAEQKVILLPGSEFVVLNWTKINIGRFGQVLKVKLKFNNNQAEKHIVVKNIVNKINHIRF